MILIISFVENEHVEQVRRHLKADSVVVDQAWFPSSMRLDVRLADENESMRIALQDGQQVILGEVGAVWNRRIRPFVLDPTLTDADSHNFAWSESNEGLLGAWHSIRCFWMNPPVADEIAQRKIRQLQVARQVGLQIPETLVTNDPSVARDFIGLYGPGDVICKAFRNLPATACHTRVVTAEDLSMIDSVRYAPVTFQRFVPACLDLRITVVGDDVFATSIESEACYNTDYRPGLATAKVEPYQLPEDVHSRLLALMQQLELQFGAIDARVTPEGEHVFLEVNPAGEYLFVSQRTGQPIPEAIAACLDRHEADYQRRIARS